MAPTCSPSGSNQLQPSLDAEAQVGELANFNGSAVIGAMPPRLECGRIFSGKYLPSESNKMWGSEFPLLLVRSFTISMDPTTVPSKKRFYTSAPGSNYLLPSDEPERVRLNTLHESVTRRFGNNLLLSPVSLKAGDKVLDTGAGACEFSGKALFIILGLNVQTTGSWLLDLTTAISSDVEIFGSDVEPNLFPKNPPPNVKLVAASVCDFPKDWTDTFQLVHQRFLIYGLTTKQWVTAIDEIFRVTKPGGWVEICEFGPALICPSQPDHKLIKLTAAFLAEEDRVFDIALLLPNMMGKAGFIDINSVSVDVPLGGCAGKDGEAALDVFISFYDGLRTPVMNKGGLGIVGSEMEYDEMVRDYAHICNETEDTMVQYYTVYGRKPLVENN